MKAPASPTQSARAHPPAPVQATNQFALFMPHQLDRFLDLESISLKVSLHHLIAELLQEGFKQRAQRAPRSSRPSIDRLVHRDQYTTYRLITIPCTFEKRLRAQAYRENMPTPHLAVKLIEEAVVQAHLAPGQVCARPHRKSSRQDSLAH